MQTLVISSPQQRLRVDRGVVALLVTIVIWGSTFVVTKVALRSVGPLSLTVIRFVVAYALLAPLAARQGYRPAMSLQPTFLRFGLTGVALYYGLQNLALQYTSAVNTVLILTIIPAVTAVLAVWLLHERLTRAQIGGIAVAVLGTAVVGATSGGSRDAPNPLLGNMLVVGSVVAWAFYTIQGKQLSSHTPALVSTAASFGAGLLMLLPLGAVEIALTGLPRLDVPAALAILYLALVATALPMFLWNYALQHVGASVATLYLNLIPIVGALLAVLTGEALGVWQVLGGLLTLVGVVLSTRETRG